MSAEWRTARLGDVCAYLNRGISPRYVELGGVRVVNQKCVRDHRLSYAHARRHDDSVKRVDASRLVQVGDVLVNSTGTGTLGRVAQIRKVPAEPTTVDSHVTIVRPRPDRFHLPFFGYMMVAIEDLIKQAGEGCGGQIELARSTLANDFLVRFPVAATEQQRLAELLDEAFEGIAPARANAERNLRNARALFESYTSAVFAKRGAGWIETTVDRLSTNLDGKRVPITKSSRKPGEVPYYGASGVVDHVAEHIFVGDALLVSEDGANLLARSTPIAFSVTGKYWVNNHAHVLRFGDMATQRYVEHYLESIAIDAYVTGAAQPKLTQKALNSIPILIPGDRDERAQIVERLDAMSAETERLAPLYERKLAALDDLKRSLLHHAFTGQLTERTAAALGA